MKIEKELKVLEREELKQIIIDKGIIGNAKHICVRKTKMTPDIFNLIVQSTSNCRDNLSERIYWILNGILDYPECLECGIYFKPKAFYGFKDGYKDVRFCSHLCCSKSSITQDRFKATCLERFGFEHNSQNPEEWKRKAENYFAKTGYYHVWSNPEVRTKLEDTYEKRTGFRTPFLNPETREKANQTNFLNTGYREPFSNPLTREKAQLTLFENTGYRFAAQNPKYFQISKYKFTHLPSGKQIYYQGHELVAITALLLVYNEEQIVLGKIQIPTIWYEECGKSRCYFPDIFLPIKNLIIEVKSRYTYEQELEKNQLKRQACLDQGYDFEFWICSATEVLEIIK